MHKPTEKYYRKLIRQTYTFETKHTDVVYSQMDSILLSATEGQEHTLNLTRHN